MTLHHSSVPWELRQSFRIASVSSLSPSLGWVSYQHHFFNVQQPSMPPCQLMSIFTKAKASIGRERSHLSTATFSSWLAYTSTCLVRLAHWGRWTVSALAAYSQAVICSRLHGSPSSYSECTASLLLYQFPLCLISPVSQSSDCSISFLKTNKMCFAPYGSLWWLSLPCW